MALIRSKDTKPEIFVRKLIYSLGYRYRLHRSDILGRPDLAFTSRRAVIFVHGCFWHGHACRKGERVPKTNVDYWMNKIASNVARDKLIERELRNSGWSVLTIWECEIALKNRDVLLSKVEGFLESDNRNHFYAEPA